jgi:hypothetical protein
MRKLLVTMQREFSSVDGTQDRKGEISELIWVQVLKNEQLFNESVYEYVIWPLL